MKSKTLISLGIGLTIALIVICIWLATQKICFPTGNTEVICKTNFRAFMDSPPNEKGDALAGIAGSLAFLWIIITVLLQGKELSLQRKELERTRNTLETQTSFLANQDSLRHQEEIDKQIRSKLKTLKNLLSTTDFEEFTIVTIDEPRTLRPMAFVTNKFLKENASLPQISNLLEACSTRLTEFRLDGYRIEEPNIPKRWSDAREICIEILTLTGNASEALKEEIIVRENLPALKKNMDKILHREIWSVFKASKSDFDL